MRDQKNVGDRQAGFAISVITASGVAEFCPHHNPILTGKDRNAAYSLAREWFKQGSPGAQEFHDLEAVRSAVCEQLQLMEPFCQICQGLEL
jgi:hypothetical protein